MKVFADTNNEQANDVEKLQIHNVLVKWLQSQFDNYNYGAEAIVMLSDNLALFLKTPDELAKVDFNDITIGIDDGVLKVEFDNDGEEFYFGFLTESKLKKYSGEITEDISLTNDEDLIKELKKTQGVKVTPLKCKDEDEFLESIK